MRALAALLLLSLLSLLSPSGLCPAAAQDLALSGNGPVEVLADGAIEWRRDDQTVVARGNARASRDGTTVFADRLIARYRPRRSEGSPPAAGTAAGGVSGGNEIWRLEAEGNVRIVSGADRAQGDRAVYDLDRRLLVLTGRVLSLTNGTETVTARDALEYWAERRMAVARGGAVVTAPDRRLEADTIAAYFAEGADPAGPGVSRGARRPPTQPVADGASGVRGAIPGAGRLDRAEAFGNVRITTPTEVIRGDRGVYTPGDGIARLFDNVRITRGENQLNGAIAEVNLRTGVSRLIAATGGRVAGMIVPDERGPPAPPTTAAGGTPAGAPRR